MGCTSSTPISINKKYQDLLGQCWYFPQRALPTYDATTAIVSYWGDKGANGCRPNSMFIMSSDTPPPIKDQVAVNKPKKMIAVHDGIIVTPNSNFEMKGVSDDKISHYEMSGVNVGFALGMTGVGLNFGIERNTEHGKGKHHARFLVVVNLYSLSINLQSMEHHAGWIRAISDRRLAHEELFERKFGTGVVTEVVFGGVMMLELDQTNYEAVRNGFGGDVKLSGGLDGVGAQVGAFKHHERGKQSFECSVITNGGRRPKKELLNVDATGLLEIIKKFAKDLEEHPHEAVPLRVGVTKYEAFVQSAVFTAPKSPRQNSSTRRFNESKRMELSQEDLNFDLRSASNSPRNESFASHFDPMEDHSGHHEDEDSNGAGSAPPPHHRRATMKMPHEGSSSAPSSAPTSTSLATPSASAIIPDGSMSPTSPVRKEHTQMPSNLALSPIMSESTMTPPTVVTESASPKELNTTGNLGNAGALQQQGANYVLFANTFLPHGNDEDMQDALLDDLLDQRVEEKEYFDDVSPDGSVMKASPLSPKLQKLDAEEATLELYSSKDWLNCVAAIFMKPNRVFHLDLHEVDMIDWQAKVLAGILEGSKHTAALHALTLTGNLDVTDSGATAVYKAIESIAERRERSDHSVGEPFQLFLTSVADCPEEKEALEKLQAEAHKGVRVVL